MVHVQIITGTIDYDINNNMVVNHHISNENYLKASDIDGALERARRYAQEQLSERGYTLKNQTLLLAEDPFPCYEKN